MHAVICVVAIGFAVGGAAIAHADPGLGLSPCALLADVPDRAHPVRRATPFAAAFKGLDGTNTDPRRAARAFAAFATARDRLLSEAVSAFTFRGDDPTAFDTRAAQRFMAKRVLAPNAPLRIGRDVFELAPPIVAGLMLAACRAGDFPAAIAEARRTTAPDAATVRAGAALLLLFPASSTAPASVGTAADFAPLVAGLAPDNFLHAFVLAEIALRSDDAAKARTLNATAASLAITADQHEVWLQQQKRLP